MLLTKIKIAAAVLVAVGLLGTGIGVVSQRVLADKPAAKAAGEKGEKKPEQPARKEAPKEEGKRDRFVEGVVKSIEGGKINVTTRREGQAADQTFDLAKDVRVAVGGKDAGTLDDIKAGTPVVLLLGEDKKTVEGIRAGRKEAPAENKKGGFIEGVVKSVDTTKNTITLTVKKEGEAKDETFEIPKDARFLVEGNKDASLADIKAGMRAGVYLNENKAVLGVRAGAKEGAEGKRNVAEGVVKAVDAGKNTITVTVRKEGETADQTFELAKDLRVIADGKDNAAISDIKAGDRVQMLLSEDKKSVTAIKSAPKKEKE